MTKILTSGIGASVRQIIRKSDRAILGTADRNENSWPYTSLALVTCDLDASPLLLLSDIAEHTQNIAADNRVSLLLDDTAGLAEPLTGSRATIMGRAEKSDDDRLMARYLRHHPSTEMFAGFGDFNIYKIEIIRAHLVAGFGKAKWVEADRVIDPVSSGLSDVEADIIDHMNEDHGDALQSCAANILGLAGDGWRMTGCDCEGIDLHLDGQAARLAFDQRAESADAVREQLVILAKRSRS